MSTFRPLLLGDLLGSRLISGLLHAFGELLVENLLRLSTWNILNVVCQKFAFESQLPTVR
eukprot:1186044-Prorocentrum_minimum.AAC.5